MDGANDPLDPTRLVWFGLIALAMIGLGAVVMRPPQRPAEELPTPAPSPEIASLQCLDGRTFRSVDELVGQQQQEGDVPAKGYWTIAFANGGYVMNQVGVSEAGRYRCDGGRVLASSTLGSHRGQYDAAGNRLAWDGQGYELTPMTVSTSG